MKCYCSFLKEDKLFGKYIGLCCKKHDNDTGQAGSFNFLRHTIDFYKCISKDVGKKSALLVSAVVLIYVTILSPYYIYKKINFRLSKEQ